jgi:epoxyqueuosine reductase QueG
MINNLTVTSPFLTTNSYSAPFIGNTGQSAGEVRWNINSQQMEVYDGSIWQTISQNVSIGMSYETDEVLRWAGYKMREEAELKKRMEKYPTLKSAYEQFKMVEALVHEENSEQSA